MRVLVLLCFAVSAWTAPVPVLWREPPDPAKLELGGTMGTPVEKPAPPFRFIREDPSGTQLKLFVTDAHGTEWHVKFGFEVKSEVFGWRLVRACGYFAEPSFLIESGHIDGVHDLKRADESLHPNGDFTLARFQFRDPQYKFVKQAWSWTRNPFNGTPQLAGLKILIMLLSNWDNKDSSNRGPNTAIFQHGDERIYAFTDWGAGMGHWGHFTGQTNWRCDDYTADTPLFIKGVRGRFVVFGYQGGHQADFKAGVRTSDVKWLLRYLSAISDDQLKAALRVSGARGGEEDCFAAAMRTRIKALERIAR